MRSRGAAEKADERILGSGDFVDKIVVEAEERQSRLLTALALRETEETIRLMCEEGIRVERRKSAERNQSDTKEDYP